MRVVALHFVVVTMAACAPAPEAKTASPGASVAGTPSASPPAASTSAPTAASSTSAPDSGHAPLVRIGDIASPATFDVASTLSTLVLPQIQSCYETALATTPSLHGKMLVSFDVNGQGAVTSASETKSTTNNPPLFACIKSALTATAFPKPPGTATVTMPLVFRP